MATISISQLDTATQAKVDDLYEVAVVDENSQTGYASRKLTAAQIATLIAQGVQFSGLSTEAKTIIAAINEASENGGTEVEPNPTGTPTDTLQKIGIDGMIYEVGASQPVSKTVTGNPINITDAADAPIVSGTVEFEPIQNLHGYDKPWAGGAGKNKLPMVLTDIKSANTSGTWTGNSYVLNGVTFDLLTDADENIIGITANGENAGSSRATLNLCTVQTLNSLLDGSYVFSGCPNDGSESTYRMFIGSSLFNTGNEVNFSTPIAGNNCGISIYQGYNAQNLTFYPMIRLATETDATFEPYSNICPIEGYTDCEVEVTGKNLLQNKAVMPFILRGVTFTQNYDGSITANGTATNGDVILPLWARNTNNVHLPSGQYTYKACPSGGSVNTFYCQLQSTRDGSLYEFGSDYGDGVSANVLSTDVMQATIRIVSGVTVNNVTFYPQLEKGSTATPYEPYQSTTHTIDLDGTRYGGKVNPVSGKMEVTKGYIASYAGETIGEPWLSDRDEYVAGTTPSTGAEVVYTLASPTIVQLTTEQIRTLEGTNNISTNMNTMSLEYITEDYQPLVGLAEENSSSKIKYGNRHSYLAEVNTDHTYTFEELGISRAGTYLVSVASITNQPSWGWFYFGVLFNADRTDTYQCTQLYGIKSNRITATLNETDKTISFRNTGDNKLTFHIEVLPMSNV